MKILHILNDGPSKLTEQITGVQSGEHEVKIIDLSKKEASYETIVSEIFSNDKVMSW